MSVFESFYLLFKADTSDLKRGEKDVKRSENAFNGLAKAASEAALAFVSLGAIIAGIKSAAEYAEQLALVSRELNVSTEALDAWGSAVNKNGGTVQGFQQTLRSLNDNMLEIAATGTSSLLPTFTRLGIHVRDVHGQVKSVVDLLPQIADSFQRLGKTRSKVYGKQLGLDIGTIQLLQQGRKGVDDLIKKQQELGLVTAKDAEIAHEFSEQWKDTTHAMRSVFLVINSSLLPVLTQALKVFETVAAYFIKHSNAITGALIGISIGITGYLIPAIISLLLTFSPIVGAIALIGGLAIAFGLLYDDLQAFRTGNDSIIGDFIRGWKRADDYINQFADMFVVRWQRTVEMVYRLIHALGVAKDKLKSFLGFGGKDINSHVNLEVAKSALTDIEKTPIALQAPNSLNSNVSNQHNSISTGPITINTQATDANGISQDLDAALKSQLRQAINNFSNGVMA